MTASRRNVMAAEIYRRTGVSRSVASEVLGALADMAMDGVLEDGTFSIPGIVTINVYERPPMRYKDIHTGRYREAPSGYKVKATPASCLGKGVRAASHGRDIRRK